MKIKPLLLAMALGAALPLTAQANLNQQVNEMFNGMINATAPGAYKTATRGVVTGGGVVLRNRITTANIISITPPSAKGGCGGINLYTGSFSFINAEEFVGLLRNVASNAVGIISGFAFNLALEAMDSMTAGVISKLANKIQQLNQMFSNSCQLASGLVTNAFKAVRESSDLGSATSAFVENVTDDYFGAKNATATSPASKLIDSGKLMTCKHSGNVVWCGIKKVGLASQFVFGSEQTGELALSIIGSWNVTSATDEKGGKDLAPKPIPRLITEGGVRLMVEGTGDKPAQVYKCNDNDCLEPSATNLTNFKGLAKVIVDDMRNANLLEKVYNNTASEADMIKFNYLARSNVGVNLIRVSQKSGPEVGYQYLNMFSKRIGADAAYSYINAILGMVEQGVNSVEMPDANKVISQIGAVRQDLHNEYLTYLTEQMKEKDADEQARIMMQMSESQDGGELPQGTTNQNAGS